MGIHCHQPVGNFEDVFKWAYDSCYLPFLKAMEKHPRIKFSVHYSGILYDWFIKNRPEIMDLLLNLVQRGQVEILTGGYYEPILPIIPDEDKLGQIEMMNEFIKEKFKISPSGLWLTERIWEPTLPKILAQAGIDYITVDDYHFLSAGIEGDKLFGYYLTEEEGDKLKVFPINKELRYLIPFKMPEETINYLRSIATEKGDRAAILADDGEKFGVWPGTYKWVYEDGYLEKLLSCLDENLDWIIPMKFSDYVEDYPSSGRTYLPTASYFEMMEWSLPSDQQIKLKKIKEEMKQSGKYDEYNKFLRGGFFRNFFVKYPESNNMHKKMLLVSKKLGAVRDSNPSSDRKKLIKEAEKNLYKGQCNCAYWHGIFGGLYLSNLRNAIYEHLIRAENILQRLQRGDKKYTELLITDFDKEGNEEILLSNPYLNMYFSPQEGGALFEMDYKPKEFNCMNVLTRRKEAYHESILNGETGNAPPKETHSIHDAIHLKEEGIEKYLVYDSLRRASFVDHFLSADADLNELKFAKVLDLGDFAGKPYAFFPVRKNDEVQLNLSRIGKVNGQEVKLTKTISLMSGQSIVSVDYEIVNNGEENIKCIFGIEFNLTLLGGNSPDRYYKINWEKLENSYLASEGVLDEVKSVQLVDEWKGFSVSFELNYECNFVRYPIETVSQSEGGLEKTYQGSCLFFSWEINIAPKEVWTNRLILKIES